LVFGEVVELAFYDTKKKILVMHKLLWLLPITLTGCGWGYDVYNLDIYPQKNKKIEQEQQNSSFENRYVNDFSWVEEKFPNECQWFELERVVDGDTVIGTTDESRERIRLVGIDTPESKREGSPIEPFALEATQALEQRLAIGQEFCLVSDEVGDSVDTYGRLLGYIITEEGIDINATMVRDGWARAYTRFPMERAEVFEALEQQARLQKVGQWQ
jgi:micrococcal nuclease